jgi:hypothetical protein
MSLGALAGCGKTVPARENFDGPHTWHNGRTFPQDRREKAEVEAEAEVQMRTGRSSLSLNLDLNLLQGGRTFSAAC